MGDEAIPATYLPVDFACASEALDAIFEIADDWRCDRYEDESEAFDEIERAVEKWRAQVKENEREKLRHCQHEGQVAWFEYDARGIPLCKVCDLCKDVKLSAYRPEVLTDPGYDTYGETIEEDDWG